MQITDWLSLDVFSLFILLLIFLSSRHSFDYRSPQHRLFYIMLAISAVNLAADLGQQAV
jgi:hypothetical protein